ncbi:hypothetical protein [Actinomadura madurae]|uniref:hypothetical protein n=1 Tax=Actinomadura madurae TaxID=1993 RepID=UPI0020D257C2|nr:hypothetical protein [Actinomadura madurae]MCP9980402.1 hypothetical protein [Actinomadura madurae]
MTRGAVRTSRSTTESAPIATLFWPDSSARPTAASRWSRMTAASASQRRRRYARVSVPPVHAAAGQRKGSGSIRPAANQVAAMADAPARTGRGSARAPCRCAVSRISGPATSTVRSPMPPSASVHRTTSRRSMTSRTGVDAPPRRARRAARRRSSAAQATAARTNAQAWSCPSDTAVAATPSRVGSRRPRNIRCRNRAMARGSSRSSRSSSSAVPVSAMITSPPSGWSSAMIVGRSAGGRAVSRR